jgi:putative phosphoesterase
VKSGQKPRLAIIADTHLPRGSRALPEAFLEQLRAADLIVHAGDFVARSVYDEIVALGPPVVAVHGNQDDAELRQLLPAERVVEAGGARFGLIHDAGPAHGRLARMRRRFGACDAVVFGHSHIPLHETADDGFQIFNPGSPTDRRRQPAHTMGIASIDRRHGVVFTILAAP